MVDQHESAGTAERTHEAASRGSSADATREPSRAAGNPTTVGVPTPRQDRDDESSDVAVSNEQPTGAGTFARLIGLVIFGVAAIASAVLLAAASAVGPQVEVAPEGGDPSRVLERPVRHRGAVCPGRCLGRGAGGPTCLGGGAARATDLQPLPSLRRRPVRSAGAPAGDGKNLRCLRRPGDRHGPDPGARRGGVSSADHRVPHGPDAPTRAHHRGP
jgi:hypothetical protein